MIFLYVSFPTVTVCLVGEPRDQSGADPLPRVFGWGAAGAERHPTKYSLERDGAAPLRFLLSVHLPSPSRASLSSLDPLSFLIREGGSGARA
jgi:hypothetical protein